MNRIFLFLAIFTVLSCNNKQVNPEINKSICPETTVTFDYELKDVETGENFTLVNQQIPTSPVCVLIPSDTIRLCKRYGEENWHTQGYYEGTAEVDHCESMKYAILVSIKRIDYHYKE